VLDQTPPVPGRLAVLQRSRSCISVSVPVQDLQLQSHWIPPHRYEHFVILLVSSLQSSMGRFKKFDRHFAVLQQLQRPLRRRAVARSTRLSQGMIATRSPKHKELEPAGYLLTTISTPRVRTFLIMVLYACRTLARLTLYSRTKHAPTSLPPTISQLHSSSRGTLSLTLAVIT
jgi:hypothetical protein